MTKPGNVGNNQELHRSETYVTDMLVKELNAASKRVKLQSNGVINQVKSEGVATILKEGKDFGGLVAYKLANGPDQVT